MFGVRIRKIDKGLVKLTYNSRRKLRFFVTPLAEIIKNSSRCSNDRYSNEPRYVLTFRVRFWDPTVATMVQTALHERGLNASTSEILPLPMQNVIFLKY
jgi:hypothetical protein